MNWIPKNNSQYKWSATLDSDVRRFGLLKSSPIEWDYAKKYLFAINYLNRLSKNVFPGKETKLIKLDKKYFYNKLKDLKGVGI